MSLADQNAYRNCLKLFDAQQFKKGLKAAEQLLAKYPDYAELSCTKGLFLVHLHRLDEGLACIKTGLMKDLKSSTNWHIYGIYYKVTKNYDEAYKCYLKASKFDENNMGIKRDLCHLLGYNRMYTMLVEQLQIVNAVAPTKMTWLQLGIAYYFLSDFGQAMSIMNKYEDSFPEHDRDYSNLVLFKSRLFLLTNEPAKGLVYLNKHDKYCKDPLSLLEMKAQLLLKDNKFDQSLPLFKELLQFNAEDPKYVEGCLLAKCKVLKYEDAKPTDWSNALAYLNTEFNSYFIRFKWISTLSDAHKSKELVLFMKKIYYRHSPGFWRLFKHIYDQDKELYNKSTNQLGAQFKTEGNDEHHYWFLYSKYAQFMDLNDIEQATVHFKEMQNSPHFQKLSNTDKIDFMVANSKLYKRNKQFIEAAEILVDAMSLDPGDRSLNVRYCKYLIRGNQLEKALNAMQMFLRKEPKLDMVKDLLGVQCIWLIYELLQYFRGTTVFLKLAKLALSYFQDMRQDDLDFQGFCMRKSILEPFIDNVKWVDTGMSHRFISKIGRFLAKELPEFKIDSAKVVDNKQLASIFGPMEDDLDGQELFAQFNEKDISLQLGSLLVKLIDDNEAQRAAFDVYYKHGNFKTHLDQIKACVEIVERLADASDLKKSLIKKSIELKLPKQLMDKIASYDLDLKEFNKLAIS